MSVRFYTDRAFPRELRQLGGYGDYAGSGYDTQSTYTTEGGEIMSGIAETIKQASPWQLLASIFVDKPRAEAAGQVAQAEIAARAYSEQQAQRQETLRTVLLVGAGLVGVLVIVVATRPKKPKPVAGYRRKNRRRR